MGKTVVREGELTLSNLATIYGCCGLFDLCADADLMSLHFAGTEPFMDWLGWVSTDVCVVKREFIAWVRPEQEGGECTHGWLGDPCGEAAGVEWGKCDFTLTDFARLRRHGPVRDVTENDERYCITQPRYRLDGTPVTDDREYDSRVITEVLIQDLRRQVITGNAATAGQADGLWRLVRSGYTNSDGSACQMMDSIIVNWNGNGMGGGAGITWNGGAIAATWNYIDVLLSVFRRIMQRIQWSPVLGAQPRRVGDIILMMPTVMTRCLLDAYTCWAVCPSGADYTAIYETLEGRRFRDSLNGGMFGAGRIFLDGFEVPLIAYDWETMTGPTRGDIFLLTGQIGSVKTMHGEYLNLGGVPGGYAEGGYWSTDGGRLLGWLERDGTCVRQVLEMRPRLLSWAPWANARFQDVRCEQPGDPLSPDPCDTSFFPMGSFSPAACP